MVIGIVDLDFIFNRSHYQLNLDVMQLSSYHKKNGDKVKFCLSIEEQELGWFSELYVIYNGSEEVYIDHLINDSRVTLLGSYFYGDYCPLPQEVKDSYPDRVIYEELLKHVKIPDKKRTELNARLKKADFIRLHEASNKIFLTDNPEVILYDANITDNDYNDIISLNKEFSLYYPIIVRSFDKIQLWLDAKAFVRHENTKIFIADSLIEEDYYKILELPDKKKRMFVLRFGNCSEQYYNYELKKCLKVMSRAKYSTPRLQIEILPIKNRTYDFLFDCAKRWYHSSKAKTLDLDIFHTYFNTKEKYDLIIKIKAKDPELYRLLTYTLSRRYDDEQSYKNYRRVD